VLKVGVGSEQRKVDSRTASQGDTGPSSHDRGHRSLRGLVAVVLALSLSLAPESLTAQGTGPEVSRKVAALGIGLAPPSDWSAEFPFLDLMKQSRPWHDWERDVVITTIDEHGWLERLPPDTRAGTVFLTNPTGGPIPYPRLVVRWEGRGTISYDWSASKVGQAPGGGDLVDCGADSCMLRIDQVDPSDPIRNITIVPEQHVAAFDAGQLFNPDFVARLAPFRAVRFMDWMRTNQTAQFRWSDRPEAKDRTWAERGVPVEVMISLANTLNADAWFNLPHLSNDDYVRRFAEKLRDGLAPHLIAYVEHSNEVWNWGFPQSNYAVEKAQARWSTGGDAFMQWHGVRTAQICDVFKREVFGDQSSRVRCVLGTQTGYPGLETAALQCPLWVAEGNAACHTHGIDALGITGYFSGCLAGPEGEEPGETALIRSWFAEPDGGLAKGFEQLRDGRHFECNGGLAGTANDVSYFKQVADGLGLAIVAYEGGQHVTSNGFATEDDPGFIAFHIALNRDARMGDLYRENLQNWRERGGSLFMHYSDISTPSKWGSWGALESIAQSSSPKWDALIRANSEPCWWKGCDGTARDPASDDGSSGDASEIAAATDPKDPAASPEAGAPAVSARGLWLAALLLTPALLLLLRHAPRRVIRRA
jgi:hypothetical protein